MKNKGEIGEFNIQWRIRRGFLRRTEQWETHVKHPTKHLAIRVTFPKDRPPRRAALVEGTRQRSHDLGRSTCTVLPDGRRMIAWDTDSPRLYENYILEWDW